MQKSLIITSTRETLSKDQQAFNRLIKKIEKLRNDIQKKTVILDEKLKYYSNEIAPIESESLKCEVLLVKTMFKYFKTKIFKGKDKSILRQVIKNSMDNVMGVVGETDEELQKIFRHLNGVSYDQFLDEEFEMKQMMMNEVFEQFGFNINTDNMRRKMSDVELIEETEKLMNSLKEDFEQQQQQNGRKKTKKQLEREQLEKQKEELKSKNVSQIFKQLAKMFHPDLEQDEVKRMEKEELMKQLTMAYDANDLHTLLRLELDYIHKEESDTKNLTDEKLKVYNQVLREQAKDLEYELIDLPSHPQYSALHHLAGINLQMLYQLNLKLIASTRANRLESMQFSLSNLQASEQSAIWELKDCINTYRGFSER